MECTLLQQANPVFMKKNCFFLFTQCEGCFQYIFWSTPAKDLKEKSINLKIKYYFHGLFPPAIKIPSFFLLFDVKLLNKTQTTSRLLKTNNLEADQLLYHLELSTNFITSTKHCSVQLKFTISLLLLNGDFKTNWSLQAFKLLFYWSVVDLL